MTSVIHRFLLHASCRHLQYFTGNWDVSLPTDSQSVIPPLHTIPRSTCYYIRALDYSNAISSTRTRPWSRIVKRLSNWCVRYEGVRALIWYSDVRVFSFLFSRLHSFAEIKVVFVLHYEFSSASRRHAVVVLFVILTVTAATRSRPCLFTPFIWANAREVQRIS